RLMKRCQTAPGLYVWVLSWALVEVAASADLKPAPASQEKAQSFGRRFVGLDKCNVCVGTSMCQKLYKGDIRFSPRLSSHAELPPANQRSYLGNLTDDSGTWRPVVLSRLLSPMAQRLYDRHICTSAGHEPSCSVENVLRATPRFQVWTKSHLLLPPMVKCLSAPLLRCPSQRLLDRVVQRYTEVRDVGTVQMKHFSEKDKLRLLYTLAANQHSLVLQMFPGPEGWPFPRYHGSCGRVVVWAGTRPLSSLYSSPLERRADAAYQLLHIAQSLASNSLQFQLYYTSVSAEMFGYAEDCRVFVVDTSTIGVIDLLGYPSDHITHCNHTDVFSCLSGSCTRPPPCNAVRSSQSFTLLCQNVLPQLLPSGDLRPPHLPSNVARHLSVCADAGQSDSTILHAARALMDILRPIRPCSLPYGYRYPECRYSDTF
uniref:FAM69 protein-kinase domain-containing protein n=1 Tax=Denticeps clupeoides TaxID=299321 RepID=A0AAY4AUV5_9TELE